MKAKIFKSGRTGVIFESLEEILELIMFMNSGDSFFEKEELSKTLREKLEFCLYYLREKSNTKENIFSVFRKKMLKKYLE